MVLSILCAAVVLRLVLACLAALAPAAVVAAAGPGGRAGDRSGGGRLAVVATTTQAADLVRAVGGPRVAVHAILAPNTDPHEYEVRPRDVRALARAALVVRSGGDLDGWLTEAVRAAGTHAPQLVLLDRVGAERRAGSAQPDPHFWQDASADARAAAAIGAALVRVDPPGGAGHRARAAAVAGRYRALDRAIARCVATIPPARRVLVTTHDALGYYAARYGLRVLGTVIPSLTTQGQPSAGETARLVADVRRTGARAVFSERAVNAKVAAAIGREAGARIGAPLWADALGPAGSSGATLPGALAANTRAIVAGLTGAAPRCALPGS